MPDVVLGQWLGCSMLRERGLMPRSRGGQGLAPELSPADSPLEGGLSVSSLPCLASEWVVCVWPPQARRETPLGCSE